LAEKDDEFLEQDVSETAGNQTEQENIEQWCARCDN